MRSVPKLYKESIVLYDILKPVSSSRELQRNVANQRKQEPLDTEAENAALLEAATKQRSEDRNWEH
jgi:hypothetical protein